MTQNKTIKIGTRGSKLALWQAHEVRDRLIAAHAHLIDRIEVTIISTAGDRIEDKALRDFGGKGLFTKEIEEALLSGEIDLAVHSMKDVQTVLPDGLIIPTILKREDVRDAFISDAAASLEELVPGSVVGTASLRRQAQVKQVRPDLKVVTLRGSVETRLQKIADGVVDATFLAVAGLNRLNLGEKITAKISPEVMLPAVAQGAIGVECRASDDAIISLLGELDDDTTHRCVIAERSFLKVLDGSCRTPIAALAVLDGARLHLRGQILAPDGSKAFRHDVFGSSADADSLGVECGEIVKAEAGPEFMASLTI